MSGDPPVGGALWSCQAALDSMTVARDRSLEAADPGFWREVLGSLPEAVATVGGAVIAWSVSPEAGIGYTGAVAVGVAF